MQTIFIDIANSHYNIPLAAVKFVITLSCITCIMYIDIDTKSYISNNEIEWKWNGMELNINCIVIGENSIILTDVSTVSRR